MSDIELSYWHPLINSFLHVRYRALLHTSSNRFLSSCQISSLWSCVFPPTHSSGLTAESRHQRHPVAGGGWIQRPFDSVSRQWTEREDVLIDQHLHPNSSLAELKSNNHTDLGWSSKTRSVWCKLMSRGGVSLAFCELSKIFSRNLCIAEIVLLMRISSWNFVCVPKAMLWAHIHSFSLKLSL